MQISRAIIILGVVSIFICECDSVVRLSKGKRKRQRRKKKKQANDPANLFNMLGSNQCGAGFDINSLFSSMFLSPTDVDELVEGNRVEMTSRRTIGRRSRYVIKNRISKRIGTMDSGTPAINAATDDDCCKTMMNVTAPGMVMMDGRMMSVVHMNHSYQFVQEGECVNPGKRCRKIGICSQVYKYAFMLLYDPELTGKVNPPVTYGRVPIKSHCECMNIGRVL